MINLFGPPNIIELEKKGDVRGLVKALRYRGESSFRIHDEAIHALVRLAPAQAVEPLIAFIEDPRGDVTAQRKAIEALGDLHDARALTPLIGCLESGDYMISGTSAEALMKFDDPRLVSILLSAVDRSYMIPPLAAQAIARYGDMSHIPLLVNWLADTAARTRVQASIALDHLGWQPCDDESGAYYWLAKDEYERCAQIGAQALMPMLVFSNNYKPIVMTDAEFGRWLFDLLCRRVIEVDKGKAIIAGKGLAEVAHLILSLADERIAAPLLKILTDPVQNPGVRVNAAYLLACMKDQRALDPLVSMLGKPHDQYAEDILLSITRLEPSEHEPFVALLNSEDERILVDVIRLLASLDAKSASAPLIALLDSNPRLDVKYEAILALGHIGDPDAFERLLKNLCTDQEPEQIKRALLIALKNKPDPRIFEPAYTLLRDSAFDHSTRLAAAQLLIALYADRKLNEDAVKLLLKLRHIISGSHNDSYQSSDCGHIDNGRLGLDFPI